MKVLLLFPMADGQTGSAIKHAFEQLGHEVMAVDAKLEVWNSYNIACHFMPNLVLCTKVKTQARALTSEVEKIKERFKDITICMWLVDTRPNINKYMYLFSLVRSCDYYFVVDTKTIPRWKEINPNTFWLPQGLQDEIYDRPKEITNEERMKYSCDVSFVGELKHPTHRHRNQYLESIRQMGVELKLWGCRGNPQVRNEEHNKLVSLSKINLCCSACPGNEQYTSVRNYKILGAGGFALELYREGIYKIFPENVIKCYTSPEDLKEKVRYWLDHDQERQQIADTAYKWVHENATYTHRIKKALEIMGL